MDASNASQGQPLPPREHPLDMSLSEPAWAIVCRSRGARAALEGMIGQGLISDAMLFLGRSLPPAYLVGWFRHCVQHELSDGMQLSAVDQQALNIVNAWYSSPSEDLRRQALKLATEREFATIGALLAATVAWSGGSIAGPDAEMEIGPAPHMSGTAAVAGLTLLAAEKPEHFDQRQRFYVDLALQILQQQSGGAG